MVSDHAAGRAGDTTRLRILVSIATYNEYANLPSLVAAIQGHVPQADLLIIDDASPDGTGKLADTLASADARIHVLHRAGKLGLGTAILAGMRYAIAHDYDLFVNMDADFSHDPCYLPALIALGPRDDLVIGSRYIRGGGVRDWPWTRHLISQAVNLLTRVLLCCPAHDCSGGYRCYRVAKLAQIDLDSIWSHGYSFQEELLYRAVQVGCRVRETPIIFSERRSGTSKVNLWEMVRSLGILVLLGVRHWTVGDDLPRRSNARVASPLAASREQLNLLGPRR